MATTIEAQAIPETVTQADLTKALQDVSDAVALYTSQQSGKKSSNRSATVDLGNQQIEYTDGTHGAGSGPGNRSVKIKVENLKMAFRVWEIEGVSGAEKVYEYADISNGPAAKKMMLSDPGRPGSLHKKSMPATTLLVVNLKAAAEALREATSALVAPETSEIDGAVETLRTMLAAVVKKPE